MEILSLSIFSVFNPVDRCNCNTDAMFVAPYILRGQNPEAHVNTMRFVGGS